MEYDDRIRRREREQTQFTTDEKGKRNRDSSFLCRNKMMESTRENHHNE
jgi:hypothetical protein